MDGTRDHFPNLPAFLAEVRRRPGMYLGRKSINALQHQLLGIGFAEEFHEIPKAARFGGFDFAAFEAWVARTFNSERLSAFSFFLAQHIAGSDDAGFDLWFAWYDRYISERQPPPAASG